MVNKPGRHRIISSLRRFNDPASLSFVAGQAALSVAVTGPAHPPSVGAVNQEDRRSYMVRAIRMESVAEFLLCI
jgi:hypothetical protein